MGCVEYPLELVPGEVIGGNRGGLDLAERQSRILCDEIAAETIPEETDDAVLFFRTNDGPLGPGAAERKQRVEVDLIENIRVLAPLSTGGTASRRFFRAS